MQRAGSGGGQKIYKKRGQNWPRGFSSCLLGWPTLTPQEYIFPCFLNKKCKLVQTLWRTVWRFLKKLEIELPYNPAIPLLGTHTEETRIERDTCTPIFISALFTIARTWKHPRCPSADEWMRELWYIYSTIRKNA